MVRIPVSLITVTLFLWLPGIAFSQSINLTSLSSPQTLPAGDDYFTDVVQNPADGTQRRMIGWEESFVGPSIQALDGVWHGTFSATGGYVFPVFHSHTDTLITDAVPGDRSLPRFGSKYPIDGSKYNFVSYRLKVSQSSAHALYWTSENNWPTGTDFVASFSGTYHDHDQAMPNVGYQLYNYDMSNLAGSFEQHKGSWTDKAIKSFRIDPSLSGPAGTALEIDWIRIVDPDSAPDITVSWASSGLNPQHIITVYHDTDAGGYDGTPIKRFSIASLGYDPSSITIPSAMLPPGDHYFYVEAQQASGGSYFGAKTQSAYSARVRIGQKPTVTVTAPSPSSGDSFAAQSRNGNEWDMDASGSDVANLGSSLPQIWRQFINHSFAPGPLAEEGGAMFQALAEPPYFDIGNQESDVQVHLDVPASQLIDPKHYRYVVYRMAIGEHGYPTIHDKILKGWVSRFVAWNTDILNDGFRAKAHLVYEGFHTYWMDLADPDTLEDGSPWESFFRLPHFRLDPGEFTIPDFYTWFYVDYVKLVGENRTPDGYYDIKYNISDADSSNFTVSFYYDTNRSGYDGTHIATLNNQSAGAKTYRWDTSGLPENNEYYVYVVVSDGTNTARAYSQVHVKIGAYTPSAPDPSSGIALYDYDGDGKDDRIVYRNGAWYLSQSQSGFFSEIWGDPNFKSFTMDIDGDGKADRGVVTRHAGQYLYYVKMSTGGLYSRMWGLPGDKLAIGDYNGDGRDELAVWRPTDGCTYVLYQNDTASVTCWGLPGDIPVHRDYDGDGKTDMAIWRPSDGMWWWLKSSTNNVEYGAKQWGLPGDIPVPARWGADSKAKYCVWRPSDGTWYIFDEETSGFTMQQWGLPGDQPYARDMNGDGLLDFVVWRPSNGTWYENYRNGTVGAHQFGLPGDVVPYRTGDAF